MLEEINRAQRVPPSEHNKTGATENVLINYFTEEKHN